MSSRRVPSPVPVLTVTVQEGLHVAAETAVTEAPVMPVVFNAKSAVSTPLTLSLKVTVKSTLVALLGVALTRVMEVAVG